MKNYLVLVTLFCVFITADTALAAKPTPYMQWDRNSAMTAAHSVNVEIAVNELTNISSLADGEATLESLRHMETRGDWPIPAREAALYQFTQSLAELPRSAVAVEVMQHLETYEARTLVPNEHHGNTLVPLFNIRGAAAGVENRWQRTEFTAKGSRMLESNPEGLVSAYAKSGNNNEQFGYLDALGQATWAEVIAVQNAALDQFEQSPELTRVIGETAAMTADTYAAQQLLMNGRGAGLASALRQLDEQLPSPETAALLTYAIQQAPSHNASLAIAAWWPRLRHEAAIRDLLVDQLADPKLGGAAALALAQSPDIQTIKILQDTAGNDSVAGRRAQMALDINRNRLVGEVQQ